MAAVGSVIICASVLVQWATEWTETTFAVILCVVKRRSDLVRVAGT
jgi:hypothetical protein